MKQKKVKNTSNKECVNQMSTQKNKQHSNTEKQHSNTATQQHSMSPCHCQLDSKVFVPVSARATSMDIF
jgi:hypothetical protein